MTDSNSNLPTWEVMLQQLKHKPCTHLLAFDPGETTGFARFQNGNLVWSEQLETLTVTGSARMLDDMLVDNPFGSPQVVVENYQVFKWRAKQHVGDTLHTPRLIGCIETLCALRGISLTKQTPQNVKTFVTDGKLKAWNMYVKGLPHARDAIRHGIFYTLFHKPINPNPNP